MMIGNLDQDLVHLAIETTGRTGSIAVLRGQEVLEQFNLDTDRRTASTLAPHVNQAIDRCRDQGCPIGLVSIANGPGSFTGLRIGVTTAKTLSYALQLPLIAVDSLAAIAAAAFHADPSVESLCVAIDAYRGQVFSGTFARSALLPSLDQTPKNWSAHQQRTEVFSGEQWENRLSQLQPELFLAGDSKPFGDRAAERIDRQCDAVGVGLLAIRAFHIGDRTDPMALAPCYLKASAAEEKL
jgi:tRNA threonylcarbamoyl adenosine modification protein YeaZ